MFWRDTTRAPRGVGNAFQSVGEQSFLRDTTRAPRGVGNVVHARHVIAQRRHNPRPSRGRKPAGDFGHLRIVRHNPRPSRGRKFLGYILGALATMDTTRAPRGVGNRRLQSSLQTVTVDTTRAPRGVGNIQRPRKRPPPRRHNPRPSRGRKSGIGGLDIAAEMTQPAPLAGSEISDLSGRRRKEFDTTRAPRGVGNLRGLFLAPLQFQTQPAPLAGSEITAPALA